MDENVVGVVAIVGMVMLGVVAIVFRRWVHLSGWGVEVHSGQEGKEQAG